MDGRKLIEPFFGLSGSQLLATRKRACTTISSIRCGVATSRGRGDIILLKRFALAHSHK